VRDIDWKAWALEQLRELHEARGQHTAADYLPVTCPSCGRLRLLVQGYDEPTCEKCNWRPGWERVPRRPFLSPLERAHRERLERSERRLQEELKRRLERRTQMPPPWRSCSCNNDICRRGAEADARREVARRGEERVFLLALCHGLKALRETLKRL
jgi:hypothetical protein